MKTLTIRQIRQSLSCLDQLLASEGEIAVTRRGVKIARILPLAESNRIVPSHKDLREKMPRMTCDSSSLVREDRDAR